MSNIFNSISLRKPKSSSFDLSHDVKMSMKMGDLIPSYCGEVVPGDKFTMSTQSLLRFAPLIAPIMHKIDVYQHFFFVPNRLVWSGWEDFITDKKTNGLTPAFPYLSIDVDARSLGDYLGLPVTQAIDKVSALPFAAYQMIYNEYYRDQNLSPEVNYKLVDGLNPTGDLLSVRKRAWQHDYFTAALPFAQKGDAVTLPIADFADVDIDLAPAGQGTGTMINAGTRTIAGVDGALTTQSGSIKDASGDIVMYDPNGSLVAKTSNLDAGAATINDLRRAFRLQEWLEKNARGGTRYVEQILSHFGVRSSDARLQRPEYLGGSKQPMVISEVLQTSDTGASAEPTPLGNMGGHGISVGGGKQFSFYAEEHGYIIGIISVIPKTAYSQGIPKHFSKFDKFDYMWPSFAHLGEQEVKNRELYYEEGDSANDGVWGYVPRYSEYKYHDSRVAGDFRTTLSYWHLGRLFAARPNLNKDFIECNPDTRIFAVEDTTNQDNIYAHIFHKINAVRKLPKYGTPEL